ncbi:GerMN domain-containing protein [Sporosalibacterium faouarense]|uniref:GerMN domain-containing protein n=1 Tax=Sporosalibacterium faouarense TaxID=516123 RepID=UPI00141CB1A1|nr:GerMN domain-containing protein [Sporosalibacterium faouarense]MTI47009.1 GerMN domain-containing protein [Bacillota bacterium]
MIKKIILVITLVAFILFSGGCVDNGNDNIDDNEIEDNNGDKEIGQEITLYFADEQAIDMVSERVVVPMDERPLEDVVIEKLQEGPTQYEQGHRPTIGDNIEIIDVEVTDATAFVNISSENLTGGSTEERFLIDSIVMSLTELDYIDKVKFLVDGESEGTLMGHFIIDEPFTRESINPAEED